MMLVATIGGLSAMLFWGVGDYLAGKAGERSDVYLVNFLIQLVALVLLLPVALFYGITIDVTSLPLVLFIALLFTIAYIAFVKALSIGPVGVAAPLSNGYALVTILVGIVFLNFDISAVQLLVMGVIVFGALMLVVNKDTFNVRALKTSTVVPALLALLTWGIGFALVEVAAQDMHWSQLLFYLSFFVVVMSYSLCLLRAQGLPRWRELRYQLHSHALWSGVLLFFGLLGFYIAVDATESVAVPAVLASASPLITSLVAWYKDGEELSLTQRCGAVVVVCGVMTLQLV